MPYLASILRGSRVAPPIVFAVAAAIGAVAVGCGGPEGAPPADAPGRCEADRECPDTQRCHSGYCTVADRSSHLVGIRFMPPEASAFPAQSIRRVSISSGRAIDFALEPSVEIEGSIVPGGSSGFGPSGTLVFRRRGSSTDLPTPRAPVSEGSFTARVLPGRYDLSFIPSDPTGRPSRVWTDRLLTRKTRMELTFPRPIEINGSLLFQPSLSSDDVERGVANARVFAVSADGRHTSTVETTDDDGGYALELLPGTGRYDLHVRPASEEAVVPEVVFEGAIEADGDREGFQASHVLGRYPNPSELVSVTLALRATGGASGKVDWTGTRVVMRAKVGKGTITETALVDDSGRIDVELLPVRYEVGVHPPADGPLAPGTFCLDLQDTSPDDDCRSVPPEPFELGRKRRVAGRLVDAAGASVSGARIAFEPLGGSENSAPTGERISTSTDEKGRFEAWLRETAYLARIVPADESGRPRTVRVVRVAEIAEEESLRLTLAEPLVVSGTVLGRSGGQLIALSKTEIEVFTRRRGRSVVVGATRADEEGRFTLVLPANVKGAAQR